MTHIHRYAALLPLLLPLSGPAHAAEVPLNPTLSALSAEFVQIGVPVVANFKKISGSINYDPAKPAEATAHFDIDTSSLDVGDELYNLEVRKKDWFNTSQFPKATLDATGLKPSGSNGHFITTAKLVFKGKTKKIDIPVTVKTDILNLVFDGTVPISRKEFSLGDPGWNEVLEDTVMVKFHVVILAPR